MSKLNWWKRKTLYSLLLVCATTAIVLPAQTYTTLAYLDGLNGATPYASVVQGTDGNLYGTTTTGGANNGGTVFKVTPSGVLTTLYSFCSQPNCTDGALPNSALVLGTDENFYGTTYAGGANVDAALCTGGCGTVFRITRTGKRTTLYSFCSQTNCADGAKPTAPLIQGGDGNLYGTTSVGPAVLGGTVFRMSPSGMLTTLYTFCSKIGCTDGFLPVTGLFEASNANFYGTTYYGGANQGPGCTSGCGTIFKLNPRGELTTLHSFDFTDGASPTAAVIQPSNGAGLYGTTYQGGNDLSWCSFLNGCGTVFKITPDGAFNTLHEFDYFDGAGPMAPLVQASDGNLYGTSYDTIFEIGTDGTFTTLYTASATSSEGFVSAVFQSTNGIFYGTTLGVLAGYPGTVYSLATGLGPFVTMLPAYRRVGARVAVLGDSLTGASSVTFNGIPAAFVVVSSTEITATVPSGATTGTVRVVTPRDTLSSNVPFRVLP